MSLVPTIKIDSKCLSHITGLYFDFMYLFYSKQSLLIQISCVKLYCKNDFSFTLNISMPVVWIPCCVQKVHISTHKFILNVFINTTNK